MVTHIDKRGYARPGRRIFAQRGRAVLCDGPEVRKLVGGG
jgi:hypothetical protein